MKKGNESFLLFVIKKVIRLWPVLAFSTAFVFVFGHLDTHNVFTQMLNLFFLQCVGLSLDYKGINWYISPLFWGLLLYFALYKYFNKQRCLVLTMVLVYFGYLANISFTNGSFGRETVWGFVNLGLCRALAGIGLGTILAAFMDSLENIHVKIISCKMKVVLSSICEIGSFTGLCYYFFTPVKYNAFIVVPLFSILFVLFVKRAGCFSKALDCSIFSTFGRYGYSIYVMQQTSFWILQRTLWKTSIVTNVALCLAISLLFSFIIGCITYHLIEKPSGRILKMINID